MSSLIDLPSLDRLFRPKSIAILGASTSPTKIGGRPVASLLGNGYEGKIYPINPNSNEVQGLQAYASVKDVPDTIDLAICSVPGHLVKSVLGECAEKGVGSIIVFSSGFAEVSDEGRAAQEEITQFARDNGVRLMGPNCMGMVNFSGKAIATFHPAFGTDLVAGRIGLVSQSGAFGGLSYMLARERRQSLSYMLTTGNEADVDIGDCTAFLAEDPNTDVILLYMEGCRDGPKFIEALELCRKNQKPVVAVKLGRTDAGAAAAASHTAALAGEDSIYEAVFRQYGVYRAGSIEEFFDIARTCVVSKPPRNDKVGLVTVSGGVGVLMADDANLRGLDVAPMPEDAQAQMREMVPFAGPRNPIDVTGQILNDRTLLDRTLELVTDQGDYGTVISFQGSMGRNPDLVDANKASWLERAPAFPNTTYMVSGFCSDEFTASLEAVGVSVFEEPTHATRAAAALAHFTTAFASNRPAPALPPPTQLPRGPLDEAQALELLSQAGIGIPNVGVASTAEEAARIAANIGFPVVLKVLSADIVHKSDIGGVRLGLADQAQVREAFDAIQAAAKTHAPDAKVRGCLVAPMVKGGVETILGVQRDPVFGAVVMFGLGGIFVEALKDVTFRVAPFGVDEARDMIEEVRAFPILQGLRGQAPSDIGALAEALSALSCFAKANEAQLESLDINPFVVMPDGAIALDGVLVTQD